MKHVRGFWAGWFGLTMVVACAAPGEEVAERETRSEHALTTCVHAICASGGPLVASCDPCASRVCALDPYCCSTAWDATCVGEVASICGQSCTAPPPGPSTCTHPVCATGAPLVSGCATCATQICGVDPYCCTTAWDATCVGEVASICQETCN